MSTKANAPDATAFSGHDADDWGDFADLVCGFARRGGAVVTLPQCFGPGRLAHGLP
jgi:hypothetical protein